MRNLSYKNSLIILSFIIFWNLVVFNLGVFQALFIYRQGKIPDTLVWWESSNFNQHLFSIIYDKTSIISKTVYVSHSSFASLWTILWIKFFSCFIHKPYHILQNLLVFVNETLIILFLFSRPFFDDFFRGKFNLERILLLFLIIGFLISNPLLWESFLKYNSDNYFVIISLLFIYLSDEKNFFSKKFVLVSSILILFEPMYVVCLITVCLLKNNSFDIDKKLLIKLFIMLLFGVIVFIFPRVQAVWIEKGQIGSSFKFRSGLDGSQIYLKSFWSPLLNSYSNNFNEIYFIYLIALFLLFYLLYKKFNLNQVKIFVMSISGFIFSFVVFPQAVTIHRYLYDFLFLIPLMFFISKYAILIHQEKHSFNKLFSVDFLLFVLIFINLRLISVSFYDY